MTSDKTPVMIVSTHPDGTTYRHPITGAMAADIARLVTWRWAVDKNAGRDPQLRTWWVEPIKEGAA